MDLSPVILSIPIFFGLIATELVFEKFSRKKTYRLNDAITNISTGTLQQLSGAFLQVIKVGVYTFLYQRFALYQLPVNIWTFILLFILYDLAYYWEHRVAHIVNLFWGGHVVHHQSEEYNLSVALRQSSTAIIWGFPFFLPLAFLGFDPKNFLLVAGLNLLYQFWIHTEHINKMGWFEIIFNTPSHHRVHHGRDPKYIDKNFAGVFIIWDKLFGTFQQEEERPNYGITKSLKSWNPVYANFAHYIDLYQQVKLGKNFGDKLRILFNKPGWLPEYAGGMQYPEKVSADYRKYDKGNVAKSNIYLFVQFFIALGIFSYYFFNATNFPLSPRLLFAGWIVWSTMSFGFLFEKKEQWVLLLEILRLLFIPLYIFIFKDLVNYSNAIFLIISTYALISILWLLQIRRSNSRQIQLS